MFKQEMPTRRTALLDTKEQVWRKLALVSEEAYAHLKRLDQAAATIDPRDEFGNRGVYDTLDHFHIYGKDIVLIMEDICPGNNYHRLMQCLWALNDGQMRFDDFRYAFRTGGRGFDVIAHVAAIRLDVPQFFLGGCACACSLPASS